VASATAQPDLRLQLRVIVELLELLPRANASARLTVLPSNLLVGTDGSVLIGAARGEEDAAEQRYLAPEVRAGSDPKIAAAVYAVGALLFEAVTGYSFESFEVVQRELSGSRAMVKAAGLGGSFWEIYLLEAAAKATAEAAEERWATPREFARDLERLASDRIASRAELGEFIARAAAVARRTSSAPLARERASSTSRDRRSPEQRRVGPPVEASQLEPVRPVFDSEPATLQHQTLLGTGAGRPVFDSEPTTLKKQTLVGIGLVPPASENIAQPADAAPAEELARAFSQVREPVPQGTLLGLGQRVAPQGAPARAARSSSPASEVAPALRTESDEPPETASAVTAYPVKKSRAGRWLLALVAVGGVVAGSLEYTGGHVTRAVHEVLEVHHRNNAPSLRSTKREMPSPAVAHEDRVRGDEAGASKGVGSQHEDAEEGERDEVDAGADAEQQESEATPDDTQPAPEPAGAPPLAHPRPRRATPKRSLPKERDYGI